MSSNRLEGFIRSIAVSTGVEVDWHFSGGRACVRYLGGAAALAKLVAEINRAARVAELAQLQRATGGETVAPTGRSLAACQPPPTFARKPSIPRAGGTSRPTR